MQKQLVITAVKPIFNIDKAIVVFETSNGVNIIRRPKQALTDLQNSGRALDINPANFGNGLANVSQAERAKFMQALFKCQGAVLSGDISIVKAGDSYVIASDHPAFTDSTHPQYGRVTENKLIAEKDGVWVEGFLQIPLTDKELMRSEIASTLSDAYMAMLGMSATSVPVPQAQLVSEDNFAGGQEDINNATLVEAFGPEGAKVK